MHVYAPPRPKLIKAAQYIHEAMEGDQMEFQTPNQLDNLAETSRVIDLMAVNTSNLQEGDDTIEVIASEGCSIQAVSISDEQVRVVEVQPVRTVVTNEPVGERKSSRSRMRNRQLEGYDVNKITVEEDQDSPNLNKALSSANHKEWIQAINTEILQMKSMNVYESVLRTDVPRDRAIYPSMFVLKRKRDTVTGEITKYKARLL